MHDWEEKKTEWQKIKDSADKIDDMMMGMENQEMNDEWMRLRDSIDKFDEMMMSKHKDESKMDDDDDDMDEGQC
jgi:uncharacterized protein with NRDE domain